MSKALVIQTYGDPEIAGAIVDGMTRRMIKLDEGQLAAVRAELVRYKDKNGLRAYGDARRFRSAKRELARKYSIKPMHPARRTILAAWALLWLGVFEVHTRLSALARGV